MTINILIRNYHTEDTKALASIYYNTTHMINIQHYAREQVDEWAPASSLETEGWAKKFSRTKPIVANFIVFKIAEAIQIFADKELDLIPRADSRESPAAFTQTDFHEHFFFL